MAMILIVDDESGIREFIADTLSEAGHRVVQAGNATEAVRHLENHPFDLLMVDLRMPGELGGMDVVRRSRAEWPEMQIVVLTAFGTVETAVEAMRIGAFDFLQKPLAGPAELRRLVERALNWRGAMARNRPGAAGTGEDGVSRAAGETPGDARDRARPKSMRRGLRSFFWQLKRRHVYNVAATYAAVAFVVLQVAELVVPVLPLPAWAYSALVGSLVAGFPVALALGWIFDITMNGMERTAAVPIEARS